MTSRFPLPTAALSLLAALVAAATPLQVLAQPAADARALLEASVAFATVKGRGQTPAYAAFLKDKLVAAGWSPADVTITPVADTARLHAVWRGTGKAAPMAIIAHLDVVEANPADWVRDPFKAIADGAMLYGRGVQDNKFDIATMLTALTAMRRAGFKPGRDIHLFFSGDEETDGLTAAAQAQEAKAAGVALVINTDAGGGQLDATGRPLGYGLQAAEKTYVDFAFTLTGPGGHSSRPDGTNVITRLGAVAARIGSHRFPVQLSPITRAMLADQASRRTDALGTAIKALLANPADAAAAAALTADPGTIGLIRTTCEPTLVEGGHAANALPQRARLTVNCRILPGTPVAEVKAELTRLAAEPAIEVTALSDWPAPEASPLAPALLAAITRAVATHHPGLQPVPDMSTGATDSVFYRAQGIPSYGASALFIRSEDERAHGLDERVPLAAIAPAVTQWRTLITELAK